MKTLKDLVIDAINELNVYDLVELNNKYCDDNNMPDSVIYENDDDFLETHFNDVPTVVKAVHFGDYRYSDAWVWFNGYGNLESKNFIETGDIVELVSVIADWCIENPSEVDGIIDISDLENELEEA